ncbi:hypothetical protein E2C01_047812 [Portunus trituberculatus]|uniref:Uncharacterized protein n=1 Tax=Portunus trituberculatus TaxID=210409 RepID=A0A5B7G8H3_PORTR|nr:hypothetical protein [Portunus trituberculatus]
MDSGSGGGSGMVVWEHLVILSARHLALAGHSRRRAPSAPVGSGVLVLLPLLFAVLPLAPPLPGTLLLGRHLPRPCALVLESKGLGGRGGEGKLTRGRRVRGSLSLGVLCLGSPVRAVAPQRGVVPGPLVGIGESVRGSLQQLEFDGGPLDVVGVFVRVCDKGEAAELLLDGARGVVLRHAQHLVVVSFVGHSAALPWWESPAVMPWLVQRPWGHGMKYLPSPSVLLT